MRKSCEEEICFACDAMLGGLARWLRAFGYDAFWEYGIDDRCLVETALENNMFLLTADRRMMERRVIRDRTVRSLLVPRSADKENRFRFVVRNLGLDRKPTRCMSCGGRIRQLSRQEACGRVPPRTYALLDRFMECSRCGKILWKGDHWQRIESLLRDVTCDE